jgi:CBS domain-containing protein
VVENDRLLGIITETDVLRCFAGLPPNRDPRRAPPSS